MTERPIILTADEVRAILDGRKTQLRRVLNPQPVVADDRWVWNRGGTEIAPGVPELGAVWRKDKNPCETGAAGIVDLCPFGTPGDRLWVKEAWQVVDVINHTSRGNLKVLVQYDDEIEYCYCETTNSQQLPDTTEVQTAASMPRWASRLTLEPSTVRVERLRDIGETGAMTEGCEAIDNPDYDPVDPCDDPPQSHVAAFVELWDSINNDNPWESNPWVWVVEFGKGETT